MRRWIALTAACTAVVAAVAEERWELLLAGQLAGRRNAGFATLANLNHLLVEVPGVSTGVEYYR